MEYCNLPHEILLNIFGYLEFNDLKNAFMVCSQWREIQKYSECKKRFCLKISSGTNFDALNEHYSTAKCTSFKAVHFKNLDFSLYYDFFRNISIAESIEEIKFEHCKNFNPQYFVLALEECTNLKKIIVDCSYSNQDNVKELSEWNRYKDKIKELLMTKLEHLEIIYNLKKNPNFYLHRFLATRNLKFLKITTPQFLKSLIMPSLIDNESFDDFTYYYTHEFKKSLYQLVRSNSKTLKELCISFICRDDNFLRTINIIDLFKLEKVELVDYSYRWQHLNNFTQKQKNLQELNLSASGRLNDRDIDFIVVNLPELKKLNISNCAGRRSDKLSDITLTKISNLRNLTSLNISYNSRFTSKGVYNGIAKELNTNLLELYMELVSVNEAAYYAIATNFPNLKILHCGSRALNDCGIQSIIMNCKNVEDLSLYCSKQVTDYGLTGYSCKVQELNIKTGYAIYEMKKLKSLNLRRCEKVTDQTLIHGLKFENLKTLYLPSCFQYFFDLPSIKIRKMSIEGFETFVNNCPKIEELYLMGCSGYVNLTEALEIVVNELKCLKYLKLARHCEEYVGYQDAELFRHRRDLSSFNLKCECDVCQEIKAICYEFTENRIYRK